MFKPFLSSTKKRGDYFEKLARTYLETEGLKHYCANYHCRYGELDLVMLTPAKTVVFIEVKYRESSQFGHVLEMVNTAKKKKIRLTASHFLLRHSDLAHFSCRFDVIGIHPSKGQAPAEILWVEDAFS
ncbi:MAG: putative endonuclease [Pseudohongiellaceae bacterium]